MTLKPPSPPPPPPPPKVKWNIPGAKVSLKTRKTTQGVASRLSRRYQRKKEEEEEEDEREEGFGKKGRVAFNVMSGGGH